MTRTHLVALSMACAITIALGARRADPKPGVDWPSFRGIRATGISEGAPLATTWDVASNKGVKWKAAIPGLGHSSPVIWRNTLCVATAISGKTDAGLRPGVYGDVASVPDD